jgi:hypothetical protein
LQKIGPDGLIWLALSPAYAAMVPTAQFSAEPERAQLKINIAQRQQVELELIEPGVGPAEAVERFSQMTDQQISSLQGKIAELPAGAAVSTIELLLIVLIVILLLQNHYPCITGVSSPAIECGQRRSDALLASHDRVVTWFGQGLGYCRKMVSNPSGHSTLTPVSQG